MAFADSAAEYELSDDQFSTSELVTHKHRKINRRHTSYIIDSLSALRCVLCIYLKHGIRLSH